MVTIINMCLNLCVIHEKNNIEHFPGFTQESNLLLYESPVFFIHLNFVLMQIASLSFYPSQSLQSKRLILQFGFFHLQTAEINKQKERCHVSDLTFLLILSTSFLVDPICV